MDGAAVTAAAAAMAGRDTAGNCLSGAAQNTVKTRLWFGRIIFYI